MVVAVGYRSLYGGFHNLWWVYNACLCIWPWDKGNFGHSGSMSQLPLAQDGNQTYVKVPTETSIQYVIVLLFS